MINETLSTHIRVSKTIKKELQKLMEKLRHKSLNQVIIFLIEEYENE